MDMVTTLHSYQALIVGFGAVVLATFGNTLLELFRRSLHDRREAKILKIALIQELQIQRDILSQAMTDEQRAETQGSFLIPTDNFTPIYDQLIGKIGLLKPQEVRAVLFAYSYIILVPKSFSLIGKVRKDELSTHAEVPVKYAETIDAMNSGIVDAIDGALRALGVQTASK